MSFLITQHTIKVCATHYRRIELIASHSGYLFNLCCDNCIQKKNRTHRFESIYDLIGFLDTSCRREPISHPVNSDDDNDNNNDLGSATSVKTWGTLRAGNRLATRRRVLESWRYDCWKKNYRLCSWGAVGVMPDPVVSTLASSIKIVTVDDLLEAVSDWGYASKYGQEVLLLLKDADREHQVESQTQRAKTREENKKRKLEDLQTDEELKVPGGPTHSASSTTPLTLVRTQMIIPIIVRDVKQPTRPQPSRPRPRPVPVSHSYTRTDAFDIFMNMEYR